VKFDKNNASIPLSEGLIYSKGLIYDDNEPKKGDGTVPYLSATMMGRVNSQLNERFREFNSNHTDIVKDPDAIKWVVETIRAGEIKTAVSSPVTRGSNVQPNKTSGPVGKSSMAKVSTQQPPVETTSTQNTPANPPGERDGKATAQKTAKPALQQKTQEKPKKEVLKPASKATQSVQPKAHKVPIPKPVYQVPKPAVLKPATPTPKLVAPQKTTPEPPMLNPQLPQTRPTVPSTVPVTPGKTTKWRYERT
jgi:hypothetical protein